LVHVNEDYAEIGDAVNAADGLAVTGFFFDVSAAGQPFKVRSYVS
jgi:hypothetical protein